jgi:uncharacterized protein YegJ (DUF2314 family)
MSSEQTQQTWPVDDSDPEMNAAIQAARDSLGTFFTALSNPQPNEKSFLLKVRYVEGDRIEHIWLADLDLTTLPGTGTVANETDFPGLIYMQRASFAPDQITDWMYFEDDKLVGGFTTQLLLRRKSRVS